MSAIALTRKQGLGHFLAKHVTEQKVVSIEQDNTQGSDDMDQPSVKTTKTHFMLLIPKTWVWAIIVAGLAGGPSLMSYIGTRAGLVTKEELSLSVKEAIKATQEQNELSVKNAVAAAVAPLNASIIEIDRRMRLIELGDRARREPQ